MIMLSLALFGLLLSSAVSSALLLRVRTQAVYVDVVANAIINRNHLIVAEQRRLGRMPTAAELSATQHSSAIIWPFEITEYSAERVVYRLPLAQPQWQQRLLAKVAGTVVDGHWYGELQAPIVTAD
ncbi:hypothetical protein [Idiomarina aquatica]|mgnify:CR=1 FL=1|uniref:Uncharacterized protein n=1 Tax=Idiomarina aquatica TaxID=1327752 RepID=A0AA94EG47_9GAMM|nr:hypothetical protein [Idiomarina aquatica]RUO44769.1 hypothetical protein CWE23_01655 [Idiomarina aquatica]